MNASRLDASLAAALAESAGDSSARFVVFVRLARAPTADERRSPPASGLSIPDDAGPQSVLTATLSPSAIDALSESSLVRSLRLSQRLKPLSTRPAE
jgi:hypothetical protein